MRPILFRFIGHIARYNTNISSEHISHCPDIYFTVGSSFQAGRVFMDYKKEIIKIIDEIESQKILRYIYIIVADIYNDLRR